MRSYYYVHPNTIKETPILEVQNEQNENVFTCQRVYSNALKRAFDQLLENKYFLTYKTYNLQQQELFTCKKISRKGKVFFEAIDEQKNEKYMIAYDGWQQMIPDLIIKKDQFLMKIHKEMEEWSTFEVENREVARWRANLQNNAFQIELQIEDDAPITNPAFYTVISQCILYVGG